MGQLLVGVGVRFVLRSYVNAAKPGRFLPADAHQLETLLRPYLLQKTL